MRIPILVVLAPSLVLASVLMAACDDPGSRSGGSDSDADVDTDACDCPDLTPVDADTLAWALNVCPDDDYSAETVVSSPDGAQGLGILPYMGGNSCLQKRHGCLLAILSTGPVGQDNPNEAQDMGGDADNDLDPMPEYQGSDPFEGFSDLACDLAQLKLDLKAPEWAFGFSFDFLFASSEYNEWTDQGYNDTFYALMQYDQLNGGAITNIAFDSNGDEIEVDSNFFENTSHPCEENGSGWGPDAIGVSGSTGWLTTSWPVLGGDTFVLTFSIHDEGDCVFDSIVFLDNFQWLDAAPNGTTVPAE